MLQGNLIGRAVVEYCEGGPQVGEKSLKHNFTVLHVITVDMHLIKMTSNSICFLKSKSDLSYSSHFNPALATYVDVYLCVTYVSRCISINQPMNHGIISLQ